MNLLQAIKTVSNEYNSLRIEMSNEIKAVTSRYEAELKALSTTFRTLQMLNDTCPVCEGKGHTLEPSDSTYDCRTYDKVECPACKGTGKTKNNGVVNA